MKETQNIECRVFIRKIFVKVSSRSFNVNAVDVYLYVFLSTHFVFNERNATIPLGKTEKWRRYVWWCWERKITNYGKWIGEFGSFFTIMHLCRSGNFFDWISPYGYEIRRFSWHPRCLFFLLLLLIYSISKFIADFSTANFVSKIYAIPLERETCMYIVQRRL